MEKFVKIMLNQRQKIRETQNKYCSKISVLSPALFKPVIKEIPNESKIKGPDTKTLH
jgi:hypothetical protein